MMTDHREAAVQFHGIADRVLDEHAKPMGSSAAMQRAHYHLLAAIHDLLEERLPEPDTCTRMNASHGMPGEDGCPCVLARGHGGLCACACPTAEDQAAKPEPDTLVEALDALPEETVVYDGRHELDGLSSLPSRQAGQEEVEVSSDRLRAAAKTLRQRAEAATSGPWKYPHRNYPGVVMSRKGCLWVPGSKDRHDGGHLNDEADGHYIATMDPDMGLALADWLDNEAEDRPFDPSEHDGTPSGYALRVADLILGGDDDE